MNFKPSKLSISKKLLWIVLVTGTLGTTFSSLFQIAIEYKYAKTEQEDRINLFEQTAIPSLEEVVWNINERALHSHLETAITNRDFASIKVLNEKNELLDQQLKANELKNITVKSFELRNPHQHNEIIGFVQLSYTNDFIFQDLERKTLTIILTNLFKTIFVSIILLILFRLHFVDRLKQIAKRLNDEDWSDPKEYSSAPIPWPYAKNPDEINDVETAVNQAITLIQSHRQKLIDAATSSARLAELGIFAAGIAHEINNPLTIILGTTGKMERYLNGPQPNPEATSKSLENIRKSVSRVSHIIAGLKSLARDGSHDELRPFSLDELAKEVDATFATILAAKQIRFEVVNSAPGVNLNGRLVQLAQVLLNLVNNAADSISSQANPWIRVEFLCESNKVFITVTDSGNGIPEDLREKLFVPFFTTKDVGKGTGLGLSISAAIINKHGGSIKINSSHPHTQFVIELPTEKDLSHVA